MENETAALYEMLVTKTKNGDLVWSVDQSGKHLTAQVGELLVRVGGRGLLLSERKTDSAIVLSLTHGISAGFSIAVYDQDLRLVAKGGDQSSSVLAAIVFAQGAGAGAAVEDISSPKIAELGALLKSIYVRHSIANRLLETLKAS
jgi:hypothetical protein